MLLPSDSLDARGVNATTPPACHPFTLYSKVCVGDLVAIIACGIAGIGFIFWGIHAIRKMRQFPFIYPSEDKPEPSREDVRVDPYHVPSAIGESILVQPGVVQTPSVPERVRTRLALSEPEEDFYRHPAPISTDAYYAQHSAMTMPRAPPRAGGQSQRHSSRRSGRHVPPSRAGYEYGTNIEYMRDVRTKGSLIRKSSDGYGYGPVDDEYVRNVGPSRGSLVRKSSGDYRFHGSMGPDVPYVY